MSCVAIPFNNCLFLIYIQRRQHLLFTKLGPEGGGVAGLVGSLGIALMKTTKAGGGGVVGEQEE